MVEAERVAGAGSDMTQRCFHVGLRLILLKKSGRGVRLGFRMQSGMKIPHDYSILNVAISNLIAA